MAHKPLSIHLHFALPMLGIFLLILLGHRFVISAKQLLAALETLIWIYALSAVFFILLIAMARLATVHQICLAYFLASPIVLGCAIPLSTWSPNLYDVIATFWAGGSFFFFWAYANNHFSFRLAGLYYPIFVMALILTGLLPPEAFFAENLMVIGILITVCSLGIFLLYLYTFFSLKRIPQEGNIRGPEVDPLFLQVYRWIIGGIVFSLTVLAILDKQFGLQAAFTTWKWILAAGCPVLSALLFFFRGTSWRFIAYFLIFTIIVTFWTRLPIIAFLAPIVLLLKEMSFIAVPKSMRFLTKTWVDLFFLGCGLFVGHWLILLPEPLKQGAVLSSMIVLTACVHVASKRLERFCGCR